MEWECNPFLKNQLFCSWRLLITCNHHLKHYFCYHSFIQPGIKSALGTYSIGHIFNPFICPLSRLSFVLQLPSICQENAACSSHGWRKHLAPDLGSKSFPSVACSLTQILQGSFGLLHPFLYLMALRRIFNYTFICNTHLPYYSIDTEILKRRNHVFLINVKIATTVLAYKIWSISDA